MYDFVIHIYKLAVILSHLKNKTKQMKNNKNLRFINITFLMSFILLLSCDDIKTVKDKYPDIPEFPNFKNGILKLVKKKEILTKIDSNEINPYYYRHIRYLSKNSTFYLITFLSKNIDPNIQRIGDLYSIHLYTFKNDEIEHRYWKDDDFKINFEIDTENNDLTIGKRKYFASSNYSKYDISPKVTDSTKVDSIFFSDFGFQRYKKDKNFYGPTSFDEVIIDSKRVSTAVAHSPISAGWTYQPVVLTYYKVKYKNKVGLTKVTHNNTPMFFKCKEELYFIDEVMIKNNDNTKTQKISVYKME